VSARLERKEDREFLDSSRQGLADDICQVPTDSFTFHTSSGFIHEADDLIGHEYLIALPARDFAQNAGILLGIWAEHHRWLGSPYIEFSA
jgi:hypothetical protein